MGLLKLLNTGKSLVGMTDKLVTKVPLGEVVPNFNLRPGTASRAATAVRGLRRGGDPFSGEGLPAAKAGGPKIRSTVAPDPKLPKNSFAKSPLKRRRPKTDESLQLREESAGAPMSTTNFVPPSAGKSWAVRLRCVRESVKHPIARKLKIPERLASAFGQRAAAAVRRWVPRGPLAARQQLATA